MKKRKNILKVGLILCPLLLLLSASIASAIPVLEISNITGGFGVHATIKNVGSTKSRDVNWRITFTGGIILYPQGRETKGTIDAIEPGDEVIINSPVFGFAGDLGIINPVLVTVYAEGDFPTQNPDPAVPPSPYLSQVFLFLIGP